MNIYKKIKEFYFEKTIIKTFLKKGFVIEINKWYNEARKKMCKSWTISYYKGQTFLSDRFHIGSNNTIRFLKFFLKHGIFEFEKNGVGFSNKEQKWYGWSHRAIYGFGIGSTCKKGDAHYSPGNLEDWVDYFLNFMAYDEYVIKPYIKEENKKYLKPGGKLIYHFQGKNGDEVYKEMSITENIPMKFGRGEWTAKTLEDAHQMAVDFNNDVS